MYIAPGQGQTAPQGTKFWCQQKGLITLPICFKFQRHLYEVWFYTFFFHDLIHVYRSPRTGSIQSPGDKVLMSTETSCHFDHPLLVSNHRLNSFWKIHCFTFTYKSIRDQIWPYCKISQGQLKVIIWANLVVLEHPMMHTDSRSSAFWFQRRRFF